MDVTSVLPQVRTPTLVVHARGDAICPVEEGQLLAAQIQGAEFVELDSRNHVLLEHEPAWRRFQDAVLSFVDVRATSNQAFAALSLASARCWG